MPIIDGKEVSPDEAMLLGRCPECGQPLIPRTARAHASDHFFGRDPNDPWLSEEARRRYKLIIDFAATRYNPFTAREKREEADPDGNGMSSTPSDRPVKTFLDYVALGVILEAASAFWRGEGWSRVGAGLVGGGAVLAAHYKWDWLKEKLGDRFTTTARSVATDFRWWLVPLFLLFIYVGSPTLISEVGKTITTTPSVETKSPLAVPLSSASSRPAQQPRVFGAGETELFLVGFLTLPRPCRLRITAPPENMTLRNQLSSMAQTSIRGTDATHTYISPCQIVEDYRDTHPENFEETRTFPSPGVVVHAKPSSAQQGADLEYRLRQNGLQHVRHGTDLPESSASDIEIDFGTDQRGRNGNSS